MESVIQVLLNTLFLIGVLSLSTLGITLTYKAANVANFAQSIVATVGAFTGAWLFMRAGVNPWLAALGGIGVCFVMGWVIDALIVSNMSTGAVGRVMITLGLILIFTAFLPLVFGMIPYEFPRFFSGNFNFSLGSMSFTVTRNGIFIFAVAAVVVGITFMALNLTKWGLSVRATASNTTVASMMGINTRRITAMSWAISSVAAALGAILLGSQTTNINALMLTSVQTLTLLAFVMGGYTSFYGPVIGAVMIPIAMSLLAMISGLWANVFLYTLVLLVILIKPVGIFGKKTIEKV